MRAFLRRLFSRWYGFQEVSLAKDMKALWGSDVTATVKYAEPDRSKTASEDILGLVLQREAEAKRQAGNVKRFVRSVK